MRYLVKNVSLVFIFFLGLSCSSKLYKSFPPKKYLTNPSKTEDIKEVPEHVQGLNKDSIDSLFCEPYVLVFIFMLFLITIITWISVRLSKN